MESYMCNSCSWIYVHAETFQKLRIYYIIKMQFYGRFKATLIKKSFNDFFIKLN
jgi:hypothetical protein